MPRRTSDVLPAFLRGRVASMRPRRDAAENSGRRDGLVEIDLASMRPRRDAAENPRSPTATCRPASRFNEAAT